MPLESMLGLLDSPESRGGLSTPIRDRVERSSTLLLL